MYIVSGQVVTAYVRTWGHSRATKISSVGRIEVVARFQGPGVVVLYMWSALPHVEKDQFINWQ